MRGYIAQLQKINIDIEVVFKWFFESYLPEEFAVTGFYYNASSEGTSYLEKCKNIASEMERVLKQYRLYCKYGYIDPELFEMSSEHIIFSQLPSMQERKYIYPKSKQVQCCIADMFYNTMLCFSDDGLLNDFENFYEALSSLGRIDKKLLDRRSQKEAVHRLLLFGAITENEGFYFLNPIKTAILKHFFDKDVLCYHYCESLQTTIDELLSADHLATENTLFSIPEQHYLDYILNKATYSDGLDLRNKYSHGSTSTNEVEHCKNYVEFLKIMVLIIIKINEELCMKFPNQ